MSRSQATFIPAFDKMLDGSGLRNFHLIGDDEGAFNAPATKKHLAERYGADFTAVPRQKSIYPDWMPRANETAAESSEHRKLAIADRVIRTIRDIAFA
jgi:hypothetical protein